MQSKTVSVAANYKFLSMSKFTVTFKMPSAGDDAIVQAVADGILAPKDVNKAKSVVDKFIEYDEYVYIELDTEKQTARVIPRQN
jgi:hypothetical protein